MSLSRVVADLLTDIRNEIEGRLTELRPLVAEVEQLEAALAAIGGTDQGQSQAAPPSSRRRRPAQGGNARDVIVADLRANGPSTAKEVSSRTELVRASVSTLLTRLAASGDLVKADRGYAVAVASGDEPAEAAGEAHDDDQAAEPPADDTVSDERRDGDQVTKPAADKEAGGEQPNGDT